MSKGRQPGGRRILKAEARRLLIEKTVEVLRQAEPTPFAFEGMARHWLRAQACLEGMRWAAADQHAKEIVSSALYRLGARRPTWAEGQPEWTQPGVLNPARETCAHCGKNLPEGHYRFCSKICARARHHRLQEQDQRRAEMAFTNQSVRSRWRSKLPDRRCLHCEEPFQPRTLGNPADRWCPACQEAGRAAA